MNFAANNNTDASLSRTIYRLYNIRQFENLTKAQHWSIVITNKPYVRLRIQLLSIRSI